MTDAEIYQTVSLHVDNLISAFTVYLTLTFAFITAVYLVGSRVTKAQIIMLSLVYVFWAAAFGGAAVTHLVHHDQLIAANAHLYPSFLWHLPWAGFGATITTLGSLMSIYFVYDVRRKANT